MSTNITTANAGAFKIGGQTRVNRPGFGSMRITGHGIWGPPANRAEVMRTLKRLPDLDVNFIDTADSYGPNIAEELIHEGLHPYGNILVATPNGPAIPI